MSDPTTINGFYAWLHSLTPEFAFLLVLPFLVATAGLLRVGFFGQARDKTIAGKEQGGDAYPDNKPRQTAEKPIVYLKPSSVVEGVGDVISSQHAHRGGTQRKGAA